MVSNPFRLREGAATAYRLLPDRVSLGLALLSALLLILAFPDFDLAPLAWIALVPLLYAVVFRAGSGWGAFVLGWATGVVYLIGTCYWLTYAMIKYGGIPWPIAYFLLVPPALGVGLLPGGFAWALRRLTVRWGTLAIWTAPLLWITIEWLRFRSIGQLWNALGYSQAYHPSLIQTARWGGVYAVSGLIVLASACLAYWLGRRSFTRSGLLMSAVTVMLLGANLFQGRTPESAPTAAGAPAVEVVVIQPSVPMEPVETVAEMEALMQRHISLSLEQLAGLADSNLPRLVIWPESPMTFMYTRDTALREKLAEFTIQNRTALLINSMEPAPNNGAYNSAMLIGADGRLIAQYDKIYLLAFGEYLPIPGWVPGAALIPPIVGNFSAGERFPLLSVGDAKFGVVICFESAVPSLAGRYTSDGADAIVEITNDGYLGPTPVLRQHLGNAIFRAVENQRPVVRATNTGISGYITAHGIVEEPTRGFEVTARRWQIGRAEGPPTFYARFGDVMAMTCAIATLVLLISTFYKPRRNSAAAE